MVTRFTVLLVAVATFSFLGATSWAGSDPACGGKQSGPVANAGAKTAATADPSTDPATMKGCPNSAGCTADMAAECPYMKEKNAEQSADTKSGEATPKVAPGGGEVASTPEAAPSDPKAPAAEAGKDKKPYTLGSKVESFDLPDAKTGKTVKLADLEGTKVTALIFWNQQCPFVQEAQGRIAEFQKNYEGKGVKVVAIDAGVNNSPESIKKDAEDKPFPILINRDSAIAARFAATHTPEVFLLNSDGVIQYHGAFDSGRLRHGDATRKNYVVDAVDQMLKGEKPSVTETRAFGCTLKYAEGVKPLK